MHRPIKSSRNRAIRVRHGREPYHRRVQRQLWPSASTIVPAFQHLDEPGDRGRGISLRPVDEGQEADEPEVPLVGLIDMVDAGYEPRSDRNHPGAVAEEAFERVIRDGRRVDAAGQDRLGSPLGEQQRLACCGAHEKGNDLALVVERDERQPLVRRRALWPSGERAGVRCRPQGRVEPVASRGTVAGDGRLVGEETEQQRRGGRSTGGVQRPVERDGALVRVPVLSVKSTSMFPRSSMVTSRFTSTLRRASSRDPVDRLTLTMAGRSWGVMPMAMARENNNASPVGSGG